MAPNTIRRYPAGAPARAGPGCPSRLKTRSLWWRRAFSQGTPPCLRPAPIRAVASGSQRRLKPPRDDGGVGAQRAKLLTVRAYPLSMESKAGSSFSFCRASFRKTASHFSGRTQMWVLCAGPDWHSSAPPEGYALPRFPVPATVCKNFPFRGKPLALVRLRKKSVAKLALHARGPRDTVSHWKRFVTNPLRALPRKRRLAVWNRRNPRSVVTD